MYGIIINTEQECIELIEKINKLFKFLFDENTTSYTHYQKHLYKDEYCVIIDKDRVINLQNEYPDLFKQLPYNFDDVIELDKNNYFSDDIF